MYNQARSAVARLANKIASYANERHKDGSSRYNKRDLETLLALTLICFRDALDLMSLSQDTFTIVGNFALRLGIAVDDTLTREKLFATAKVLFQKEPPETTLCQQYLEDIRQEDSELHGFFTPLSKKTSEVFSEIFSISSVQTSFSPLTLQVGKKNIRNT